MAHSCADFAAYYVNKTTVPSRFLFGHRQSHDSQTKLESKHLQVCFLFVPA